MEILTKINNNGGSFDYYTILVLGLENCKLGLRTIDIGLYDTAKVIDANFKTLKEGTMMGNDGQQVYRYAQMSIFRQMYYSLRDYVEGETYYDVKFMTAYRVLPKYFVEHSYSLLLDSSLSKRCSVSENREAMRDILNSGVVTLNRLYDIK